MRKNPVLESAVKCLRSEKTWPVIGPEHYWNKHRVPGQYACYQEAGTFLTISVHNCPKLIDVATLANLVAGIEMIPEEREGLYCNRKLVPGYFASALSTVPLWGSTYHWIMIGIPNPNADEFADFRLFIQGKWSQKTMHGYQEFFESELWDHGFRSS